MSARPVAKVAFSGRDSPASSEKARQHSVSRLLPGFFYDLFFIKFNNGL
jgi:hypothetical protein